MFFWFTLNAACVVYCQYAFAPFVAFVDQKIETHLDLALVLKHSNDGRVVALARIQVLMV
jgi:hypothetical protein